jgi:hypothetical protein
MGGNVTHGDNKVNAYWVLVGKSEGKETTWKAKV